MPQLTFRGFSDSTVQRASETLTPILAEILECPEDYFTFDNLIVTSFFRGQRVLTYPFIEILWFDRGKEARDSVALAVTKTVFEMGIPEVEISFTASEKDNYYSNGKSFAD